MSKWRRAASVLSAVCASASVGASCPTCRDALAASDARWGHGFSVSVLFLLGVLVTVVGTFSFAVWRATRNHANE